ncbi:hypothetical protein [Ottowia thiooxydans]|uniref:hypothetical protein n=1 Tax=Ottowia thiooxydans TaxID=219182 RepID=UPI000420EB2C|nr:hypothetical protein [Ottowia thiooxydans]
MRKSMVKIFMGSVVGVVAISAWAFQIGPLGTAQESRLTREPDSSLAKAADKVGVLIKGKVHEEITHIGAGCQIDRDRLETDKFCSTSEGMAASPFVIYGVRWNDLPPFALSPGEGNCQLLGQAYVCKPQTVRFSTQPLCWYCLFKDAERTAQTKRIVGGCERSAPDTARGNLMTRSHFGDLQFLHGMASQDGMHPVLTRAQILDWIKFAWKVSSREISPSARLRDVSLQTFKDHFGCTEWTVADLYLLGRQDASSGLISQIRQIAFGSVLHTVQDSFAAAHVNREPGPSSQTCEGTRFIKPRPIVEFHTYGAQDGTLHDHGDEREAMIAGEGPNDWPSAILATRQLFELNQDGAKWADARTYVECLFELSENRKPASPGDAFRRR